MSKIIVDRELLKQQVDALRNKYSDVIYKQSSDLAGDFELDLGKMQRALETNSGDVSATAQPEQDKYTYASTQATMCAVCGEHKHTPLRIDAMGGYVCLTCIDQKLGSLLGEFGYIDQAQPQQEIAHWQPVETAPKDGSMLLICLPRQMNLVVRAWYNKIHNFWQTDYEGEGGITRPYYFHEGDLWHPIPSLPAVKAAHGIK